MIRGRLPERSEEHLRVSGRLLGTSWEIARGIQDVRRRSWWVPGLSVGIDEEALGLLGEGLVGSEKQEVFSMSLRWVQVCPWGAFRCLG